MDNDVTFVLRLVLDYRGRVRRGQVVDVAANTSIGFLGWTGLLRSMSAMMAQYRRRSRVERSYTMREDGEDSDS
jgi:hypothetical protein